MTNTQEKILEVFKKFKTPKDGIIKLQSFNTQTWDRKSQDEFNSAMQQLISDVYVSTKDGWYVLTEDGYNYIYRKYSIEDTKQLIMNVFRNHKVGVGGILMQNNFITLQQTAERFHFDNFTFALQSLISDGLIEVNEIGYYKLTQSGYDRIY